MISMGYDVTLEICSLFALSSVMSNVLP